MAKSSPPERPNVALVRRLYDALSRRDVAEAFSLFAPTVTIEQSSEVPWGGSYTGHEEAAAFFGKLTQEVTSTVTVERWVDAGDHVVAIGWTRGTTNERGKSFEVPIAHVWHVRDGRVAGVQFFIDTPTMRAALD